MDRSRCRRSETRRNEFRRSDIPRRFSILLDENQSYDASWFWNKHGWLVRCPCRSLSRCRCSTGSQTGSVIAGDIFIPIIPSSDGKSKSNNLLALLGEVSSGSGSAGGLEVAGLTSGIPGISSTVSSGWHDDLCGPIDSGIAGINTNGHMELLRFRFIAM